MYIMYYYMYNRIIHIHNENVSRLSYLFIYILPNSLVKADFNIKLIVYKFYMFYDL